MAPPLGSATPPFMSWVEAVDQLIPVRRRHGLHAHRAHGRRGTSARRLVGLSGGRLLRADVALRTPRDFMYFVDRCHQAGIGVILDWVPAHFPRDAHGLAYFDGSALYEHADSRLGEHTSGAPRSSTTAATKCAISWSRTRCSGSIAITSTGCASMRLHRCCIWITAASPANGCRTETAAARTSKRSNSCARFNNAVHRAFPGVLMIAEESTSFPGVTQPPEYGGLGFNFKWNMGWMNDTLRYFAWIPSTGAITTN